jgi:hypothetical protein
MITNALRKYLADKSLTQEEFAARFDPPVSQGLVHQWLNFLDGKPDNATRITPERSVEIELITAGAVPRHKTCKLFEPPKAAAHRRSATA